MPKTPPDEIKLRTGDNEPDRRRLDGMYGATAALAADDDSLPPDRDPLDPASPAAAAEPAAATARHKPPRRSPWLGIVVALLVFAAIGAGAWWFFFR